MNNNKTSTERARDSRTKLINQGGERFEVRLDPSDAIHRQTIMESRGIKKKKDLMSKLLQEEAARLYKLLQEELLQEEVARL